MKPLFEHVPMDSRASCSLLWRELPEIPFLWHYHPEYELTLTLNACGQRYVGDHLADFDSGDLVLVGPNVAHTWSAQHRPDAAQPIRAAVAWFAADWVSRLADVMPELAGVKRLTEQAGGALKFSAATAERVAPLLLALHGLDEAARMPVLLEALICLSQDEQAQVLTLALTPPASDAARQRLGKVLNLLHARWIDPPAVPELAALAALSVSAFHRFFKRHTGTTVLDYVMRLRMGQACQRLIDSDRPVGLIAAEVGYASLAQFNRQFRQLKHMTPSDLRKAYRAPLARAVG